MKIEVYCNLSADAALDIEGSNISDPHLRAMHLKMVPFLRVLSVDHWSFENPSDEELVLRRGQVVVHKDLQQTFSQLFEGLLELEYPIEHAIPISQSPDSQDSYSMAQNRTLVYRPDVIGSGDAAVPSEHYRASAVDINPLDNPILHPNNTVDPPEAAGRLPRLGMVLLRKTAVVQHALNLGFEWGNDWPDPRFGEGFYGIGQDGQPRHILRDPHHFELVPRLAAQLEMPSIR